MTDPLLTTLESLKWDRKTIPVVGQFLQLAHRDLWTLELFGIEPSLGKEHQNHSVTQDGNWFVCAREPGNNMIVFKIQVSTRQLQPQGAPISIPMLSCIRWLDLKAIIL